MAKKAKKKAAKKKTTKRKVSDRTLEAILIECALAVGQGVGSAVAIGDDARKFWHSDFRRSIKKALQKGESWKEGRKTVIPLATKMGAHAASLATGGTITKTIARTAADQIKKDPACPAGAGKFCS
jgi:hypothetical protein